MDRPVRGHPDHARPDRGGSESVRRRTGAHQRGRGHRGKRGPGRTGRIGHFGLSSKRRRLGRPPMTYPALRAYARGVTATVPTENGPSNVRMTPAAIDALHELARPQAEAVARAIAAIGHTEGKPVAAPQGNGRQYYAMVTDDHAPRS